MWTDSPFSPRLEGDWMYGRGAGDMKAGLAANLFALDAVRRAGLAPTGDIFFQSVIEEECTGNGALACLQRGYRADAAIIPEPGSETLLSAQVGVMWFQVKVRGRPAHVAVAGTGANAIEACWPLMQALHRLEHDWNERGHIAFPGHAHPINFVVSRIEGGDWTSSVPAWCTFDMRIGLFPGMDLAEVRREVEATIARASAADPFLSANPPEISYHGFQAEGWVMPDGGPAQNLLDRCHEVVNGGRPERVPSTGTTDARFFGLYADIPAMVYGPHAENIHAFDERVSLASTRRVTQTIALFIAAWCGVTETAR
jgi:acetylornithine deacetylase